MNKLIEVNPSEFNTELKIRGFKAYQVDVKSGGHSYNRKDFYRLRDALQRQLGSGIPDR